jgi:hypothetical protein
MAQDFGRYIGLPIKVEFIDGSPSERRMRLLGEITYIDQNRRSWKVETGFVTDGASIPRVLWSAVGGPFEGSYRNAALVHDKYCEAKTIAWPYVHRMFYDAMRAAGVGQIQAGILYAGVLLGGPRWPTPGRGVGTGIGGFDLPVAGGAPGGGSVPRPITQAPDRRELTDKDVANISEFVHGSVTPPTPEEIEKYLKEHP